jgi:hypothetical protein
MEVISRHFKIATIPPFVLTILIGIILIGTHDGSSYKSEWFANDGFAETILLTFILSGGIILLATTIFPNRLLSIRNKILSSFITWILLPGLLCFYIIYQEIDNFSDGLDIHRTYEGNRLLDGYIMVVAFLHLLFLVVSFIRFRRTLLT